MTKFIRLLIYRIKQLFADKCRDCSHHSGTICSKLKGVVDGACDPCGFFKKRK